MPTTPLERGAGTRSVIRVVERLARIAVALASTGGATRGLTTPVKPIFPKVRVAIGAWAAEGAATATATEMDAVLVVFADLPDVAAEAGRASEATMAPEMTITAEALLAGIAEREMAEESVGAELTGLVARWRPGFGLGTVRKPLQKVEIQMTVQGWHSGAVQRQR